MSKGILNGLRVLDFTRVLAGPYTTRILADFGAEVIKIQSKKIAYGAESNTEAYFNTWNRNKRSITLNMSYPEAKAIALNLVEISDVVVENFSSRVMSNWGLDYEKLSDANSALIMLSMSAMGQSGPWRNHVAFAPTIHSLSGLTYLTSFSQDFPLGLGHSYADIVAGLYGALSVLAALEYRDRTGQGQYIDLSEYEAMCTLIGPTLLKVFAGHKEILPQGNRAPYEPAAPYGCYKCRGEDRWCVIAVFAEEEWQALCDVMGQPGWTKNEEFSSGPKREAHSTQLDELLEKWTSTQSAEEVVQRLQRVGVPAGVVQNAEDLAHDPQLLARGAFAQLKHPILGTTVTDTYPLNMEVSQKGSWKAAPLLGEDNPYVFKELLGLSEEQYSLYVKGGIIG